jgi:hypothetical protein
MASKTPIAPGNPNADQFEHIELKICRSALSRQRLSTSSTAVVQELGRSGQISADEDTSLVTSPIQMDLRENA